MVNGTGNVTGYGNYGYGGYMPRPNGDVNGGEEQPQVPGNNHEETQVDPQKVMEFMAAHNYFVAAPAETVNGAEVDPAVRERVEGYMAQFEMIYGLIVEEFGERLAPAVMDLVMDTLMGMAA